MKIKSGLMLACFLWSGALAVRAADRYVSPPGGYGTNDAAGGYTNWLGAATNIQWAVNVAVAGETVWVTNGTYYLTNQISFTNGITLRSVNGRDATTVNGNYPAYTNRCFLVTNANAFVQGFLITNGYINGYGGGVYLKNGATISNCIISGNTVKDGSGRGGGVYIDAKGTVDLCSVIGNLATGKISYGGGGIYFSGGGTVTNSTIAWNTVMITNATAYYAGGGGVFLNSGGLIQNCTIASNNAQIISGSGGWGGGGGAVTFFGGSIINSIVSGNTNSYLGGGVCVLYGGTLQNCLIVSNRGSSVGSGLAWYGPAGTIRNCTIVGNRGTAGLGFQGGSQYGKAAIANCIIVSNYNNAGTLENWGLGSTLTNLSISNTCTYPTNFPTATTNISVSGCISNYPAFVNYPAGNYRLEKTSPCVNTGTNQSWMTGSSDLDGKPRIRFGIVDMGAYERIHEATFYNFH